MADDLKTIKKLEEQIGRKLRQLDFHLVMGVTNGYAIDENENIIRLNLYRLGLSDISSLKDLTNLGVLGLGSNQLSNISTLKYLTNLTQLYLYDNRVSDISALKELTSLTDLDLSRNQISDVSSLKELTNLKKLDLSDNKLSDISTLKWITDLKWLGLSNNKLSHLPREIFDLNMELRWFGSYTEGIRLYGNPLESPPMEIVEKGKAAVKTYFKSLEGKKQSLNEVKVLLLGDGGAGKTSLVKRLLENHFDKDEPQTHGINISPWQVTPGKEKIKVNLWDFGGQEIMHATHQFFLSKRSLYILVLEGRKDEKVEYWLKHIESFGGDSPVMIVINKIDQCPAFEVNRKFLLEKYPQIKGFHRTSCLTCEGVEDFSQALTKLASEIEHLKTIWPNSWFEVKKKLENMENDFIGYDEYIEICKGQNIHDEESQDTLVEFLNDLGVILHINHPLLKETNVINPEWATKAVYEIINSRALANNKGILTKDTLRQILDKEKYPRRKHDFIIELMKKFELCFEVKEDTILVPDLLVIEEPDFGFDYTGSFSFLIQYDFLPKSVIARFMVRMHREIKDDLRWRTGVVLEDPLFECTTVVKVDDIEKQLYVYVSGTQNREYFPIIRKMFLDINSSYEKMKIKEMVPCCCRECSSASRPHYYEYSYLIKALKKGMLTVNCRQNIEDVSLERLLSGIEIDSETTQYTWDVFISYSSKDIHIIKDIINDLKRHRITYWWDEEQLLAGDPILQTIEKGLKGSRFVLACFSRIQLQSGWARSEYEAILKKEISGTTDQKVLPLILDDLPYEEIPLLVSNYKHERYTDRESYRKILRKLKEPFISL